LVANQAQQCNTCSSGAADDSKVVFFRILLEGTAPGDLATLSIVAARDSCAHLGNQRTGSRHA